MRSGKEENEDNEERKMRIMRRGKEENASGCGKCIVEWSGGELKWSGVEVEWKWSGLNRFSSCDLLIFDLGAIVQSTGRRGISISISGCWYPYPDPDMQVQWIRSGGESHRGISVGPRLGALLGA